MTISHHNPPRVWIRPTSPPITSPSGIPDQDSSEAYHQAPGTHGYEEWLNMTGLGNLSDSELEQEDEDDPEPEPDSDLSNEPWTVYKYKKVDQKVRPISMITPEEMKSRRQFPNDPLQNLPQLPHHPPKFIPTKKVTEERITALGIDDHNELLPEEKKLLQHVILLNERSIAFSEDERGTFKDTYFSDYIIPTVDHEPWIEKNIPIALSYKDEIIRLLKEKVKAGVYEPTVTAYRSKWFCVKKKDGGLRMVHDLQNLNSVTIRDSAVPPIVEEFVEAYAGRSVYTVLDMYWGFHARVIDVRSRDMTAFQTPLGTFRLTSLPMGFTNAPAEFQACMMFILQDEVPDVAGVFIDDIPIKGPATHYLNSEGKPEVLSENPGIRRYMWEHINDVHRILHRIGEAGGTVSAKKMQLCQSEVQIVGHQCSARGREPVDDRIQKILDWPTPINLKEVRGFLGLCGTVRIWIKDYSIIAKPLVDLTRKSTPFSWGPEQEEAFEDLKELVTQAPALRPLDYNCDRPIILSVDSSIYGVGYILSQEDEYGRRAPARYGSIPLTSAEASYPQSKLELFGVSRALHRCRAYITGVKKLIVEVDASSVIGMIRKVDPKTEATENRWINGIVHFNPILVHVPAHKHQGPDALSRRRFTSLDEENPNQEDPNEWLDCKALMAEISKGKQIPNPDDSDNSSSPSNSPPPYETTSQESEPGPPPASGRHKYNDEDLVAILRYLTTGKMPKMRTAKEQALFLKKARPFYLKQAHMYKRRPGYPDQVVIFPIKRRREILWEMHEDIAHHGTWAVEQSTSLRYYWPGMKNNIQNHIRSCHDCQLRSTKKMHIPITISHPPSLFSKVYLDVMKMPLAHGKQWLIGCRDDLSGITECKAIARDKAKVIAKFFLKRIILRYGIVQEVVTDNGPSFGKEFAQLMEQYGIRHIKISPYNSQANGVVERGHFNIREALVKLCKGNLSQWPLLVSAACYADRITVRRATGFSPYYLLHGVHPLLPGDLADSTFMVNYKPGMTTAELIEARTQQLLRLPEDTNRARKILQQSRFRSKATFEKKYARRIRKETYEPDDLVLIRNNPIENSVSIERKTANRYMGPYCVIRQTQGGAYILAEMDGSLLRHHVAAYRLIPYVQRQELDALADEMGISSESEDESSNAEMDITDEPDGSETSSEESSHEYGNPSSGHQNNHTSPDHLAT